MNPERLQQPNHVPFGNPELAKKANTEIGAELVKNRVIYLNDKWYKSKTAPPLGLELGKQTTLGKFLTNEKGLLRKVFDKVTGKKVGTSEVSLQDKTRSGIAARIIFKDEFGNFYRDIDLKGSGLAVKDYLTHTMRQSQPKFEHEEFDHGKNWGLQTNMEATIDSQRAEMLIENGIRSDRTIAIISISEIIDKNGKKIPIEEAVFKKIINLPEGMKPVIQVRAYGLKTRIGQFTKDNEVNRGLIEDARVFVAVELGKSKEDFSLNDYVHWLNKTVAINLARLHKLGYVHTNLSPEMPNMTLDARFTDHDTLEEVKTESSINYDLRDAGLMMKNFINDLKEKQVLTEEDFNYDDHEEDFINTYNQEFNKK